MDTRKIAFYRDGKFVWVEKGDIPPPSKRKKRAFYIGNDIMDPIRHPVTGDIFESKSALRASYKEMGLIELGNDIPQQDEISDPISVYEKAIGESIQESGKGWNYDD